jgi:hypothetical protein
MLQAGDRMRMLVIPHDIARELPIVLWDHETREATDRYTNFDAWFAGEAKRYLFGE